MELGNEGINILVYSYVIIRHCIGLFYRNVLPKAPLESTFVVFEAGLDAL
jgi:hypothetical protein